MQPAASPASGASGDSSAAGPLSDGPEGIHRLIAFIERCRRLLVLTGAGCSTESGIPDYRNAEGSWKRRRPIQLQEFLRSDLARRRYWARSTVGWRRVREARPNRAHEALARLHRAGLARRIITQNVDGLHQKAGAAEVLDLHGRLDRVRCLECGQLHAREVFQQALLARNPGWAELAAGTAPDGDADLEGVDFGGFRVPGCDGCGGTLKPDVVFFGENVPRDRLARAMAWMDEADGLLVAGSSLMVWSGYRFARAATRSGVPLAAVNLGRTRADGELDFRVEGRCGDVLGRAADWLGA
ncbi:MAG TPA: NAD-dependent protein deacetylase [Gammaproteobacteria bacterium]|nr:NAD-dependent protein deacetylase [Gammaproteobacteria bacterium]